MFVAQALAAALVLAGIPDLEPNGLPHLRSESVIVRLVDEDRILLARNAETVRPVASITKLLTAFVLRERPPDAMNAFVTIAEEDKDRLKWSRSRLPVGRSFKAVDLLTAGLTASDNRAIYAFVRASGFERAKFVEEMNRTASQIGMRRSRFVDPAGVDPHNVSTATDLLRLMDAVARADAVREATLHSTLTLVDSLGRGITLTNPNRLARSSGWQLLFGKTGYTVEAGRALVFRALLGDVKVDVVLVGAREMASVFGDAGRIRRWLITRGLVGRPRNNDRGAPEAGH